MTAAPAASARPRIASVDLIRGAVMILMAIDHVRVYSGLPAGGPTPGIFFTRWVTHFCAPAFLFLAGTSACLSSRGKQARWKDLLLRGAWLIVLELTVLRFAWTFNFDYAHYAMGGVIWAIGWCMILMAGLVWLRPAVIGAIGMVIITGHNLLNGTLRAPDTGALWNILYAGFRAGPIDVWDGGPSLIILYSIVPWIGVMAAGYAFGAILLMEPGRRNRLCLAIGLGATASFLVLRGFNLYGDPRPWTAMTAARPDGPPPMPAVLAFLNTVKYPASLLFLLMTLGPTIAVIPLLERVQGAVARWVTVFGRVPFFYYVLHIPLIHALALVVSRITLGHVSPWLFANHPMGNPPPPDGYMWSLPLLYLVFAVAIVILYFPCRWFAGVKARRTDWWLRYL